MKPDLDTMQFIEGDAVLVINSFSDGRCRSCLESVLRCDPTILTIPSIIIGRSRCQYSRDDCYVIRTYKGAGTAWSIHRANLRLG